MAQEFKEGDVVRLKSGGPKMTVDGYHRVSSFSGPSTVDKTRVDVSWFTSEKLTRETFKVESLEIVGN